jgi:hypothetical protein
MAFDATDGAMERRAYLQRLRELAMERMRADELAVAEPGLVKPVSRRESLRWLGMAAVGVAAGVRPLRALAEGATGVLAERAAGVGSSRYPAPQYGAPSWYAPREPYPAPPVQGKVTMSRTELGDVKNWRDVAVHVVSEKDRMDWISYSPVPAKEGYYSDGWGGGTNALLAIADPNTDFAYILHANQSFYTVVDSDMCGCLVGPGVLFLQGSLFQRRGGKDGLASVIADFMQVSDYEASARERGRTTISLEKGIPQAFWIRNGELGWEQNYIQISRGQRRGDMMELTLRSGGYQSEAIFMVDLKARKLVKTKFEGKEFAS